MKFHLLLSLVIGTGGLACRKQAPKDTESPAEPCELSLQATSLQYRGHVLPLPGSVAAWDAVLGVHSRKAGVGEDAYVWDPLGLYAFQKRTPEQIEGFFVLLNPRTDPDRPGFDYWPRHPFGGRLCVDGGVLTSSTKLDEVNRDKRAPYFSRGYLDSIYSYDLKAPQPAYVRIDLSGKDTLESFSVSLADKE